MDEEAAVLQMLPDLALCHPFIWLFNCIHCDIYISHIYIYTDSKRETHRSVFIFQKQTDINRNKGEDESSPNGFKTDKWM